MVDPETAQFLSVDPLVSQTQTAYSYIADNPLTGTDPSGQSLWHPCSWLFVDQICSAASSAYHAVTHTVDTLISDGGQIIDDLSSTAVEVVEVAGVAVVCVAATAACVPVTLAVLDTQVISTDLKELQTGDDDTGTLMKDLLSTLAAALPTAGLPKEALEVLESFPAGRAALAQLHVLTGLAGAGGTVVSGAGGSGGCG